MTDIVACKKAHKWIDVPTSRLKIFLERKARAGDFFVFSAPTTGTGNVKKMRFGNWVEICLWPHLTVKGLNPTLFEGRYLEMWVDQTPKKGILN